MSIDESQKFGAVLKSAREEKNISISSISGTLKLSLEKIENIEASDVSSLPPAAFTCGYLRQFAKLVELDEASIVHLYNLAIGVEIAEEPPGTVSDLPMQASSNDLGMRIVSYSLGLIVIILFVLWFQGSQENELSSDTAIEVDVVADIPATVTTEINMQVSENEVENENNIELIPANDKTNEIITNENIELVSSVDKPQAEEVNDAETTEAAKTPEAIQRNKNIAMAKEANSIAGSGNDIVHLTANQDCWIEITDANKHLLFFSLLKKGEKVELKGQQPFSVFLGKATAVSIALNDLDFDVSKYVRSNKVARFIMSMDDLLESQVKQDVIINSSNASQSSITNSL